MKRSGRFALAHGGTCFLDEIAELPPSAQVKFLRLLEDQIVTPLGSERGRQVDVRVVAATNRDLAALVSRGHFREDLFYRLAVLDLRLPPLRERRQDVALLIDHLLAVGCRRASVPLKTIAEEARHALLVYSWPGNVRELENTLFGAITVSEGPSVRLEDLPVRLREAPEAIAPARTLSEAVQRATEHIERALISDALTRHHGNRSAAAEALGIDRRTLQHKIREYGLQAPSEPART
jgi:DNA-binding NtrC family response regulator